MASEIKLKVNAEVDSDAKWILNRQERMEKQRLEFIGDLFRYVSNLVLTYDNDEAEKDVEVDYVLAKECQNPDAWYMCHKCGKCGRKFEDGFMVDDGGTHPQEDEE